MSEKPEVVMYATEWCSYCAAARMLFKKKGIAYEEILVSDDPDRRREMEQRSGRRTVPQIFIDRRPIGGFDDLYALDKDGRLDELLGRT